MGKRHTKKTLLKTIKGTRICVYVCMYVCIYMYILMYIYPEPRTPNPIPDRPDPEESGPIPIAYESRYSCLSQQSSASARFILPCSIASAIQSDLNLLQCFIVSLPISNESIHSYRTLTYSLSHFPESRCDHIPIA